MGYCYNCNNYVDNMYSGKLCNGCQNYFCSNCSITLACNHIYCNRHKPQTRKIVCGHEVCKNCPPQNKACGHEVCPNCLQRSQCGHGVCGACKAKFTLQCGHIGCPQCPAKIKSIQCGHKVCQQCEPQAKIIQCGHRVCKQCETKSKDCGHEACMQCSTNLGCGHAVCTHCSGTSKALKCGHTICSKCELVSLKTQCGHTVCSKCSKAYRMDCTHVICSYCLPKRTKVQCGHLVCHSCKLEAKCGHKVCNVCLFSLDCNHKTCSNCYLLSSCGHTVCKECIVYLKCGHKPCPSCKVTLDCSHEVCKQCYESYQKKSSCKHILCSDCTENFPCGHQGCSSCAFKHPCGHISCIKCYKSIGTSNCSFCESRAATTLNLRSEITKLFNEHSQTKDIFQSFWENDSKLKDLSNKLNQLHQKKQQQEKFMQEHTQAFSIPLPEFSKALTPNSATRKCEYCGTDANFFCRCNSSYLCTKHIGSHYEDYGFEYHMIESIVPDKSRKESKMHDSLTAVKGSINLLKQRAYNFTNQMKLVLDQICSEEVAQLNSFETQIYEIESNLDESTSLAECLLHWNQKDLANSIRRYESDGMVILGKLFHTNESSKFILEKEEFQLPTYSSRYHFNFYGNRLKTLDLETKTDSVGIVPELIQSRMGNYLHHCTLPNRNLFVLGSDQAVLLDPHTLYLEEPVTLPTKLVKAFYNQGVVYCLANDSLSLYGYELKTKQWKTLCKLPEELPDPNWVSFKGNLLLTSSSANNLYQYNTKHNSFEQELVLPGKKLLCRDTEYIYVLGESKSYRVKEQRGNWEEVYTNLTAETSDPLLYSGKIYFQDQQGTSSFDPLTHSIISIF